MKLKRHFKPLAVTALVPLVFACELLLPEHATLHVGVGEALGCSGAGSTAPRPQGFTWLRPSRYEGRPVSVATDGFFPIDVEGTQLGAAAAVDGLQVVVTDEAGSIVEGETKLLLNKQNDTYLFGWSASSALEVGAELDVDLSASPVSSGFADQVGGEFSLVVVGEPTPLPDPAFAFEYWVDFYHGEEGPTLTCMLGAGGCGSSRSPNVPAVVSKQRAADIAWTVPAVTGGVAWSVRIVAGSKEPDAHVLSSNLTEYPYLGGAQPDETATLGRVAFPTAGDEHCATVVITDLRTNEESRAEKCAPTGAPQSWASDTDLGSCRELPDESLKEAWCRLHFALGNPECDGIMGLGGSGGGSNGPDPSGSGGTTPVASGGSAPSGIGGGTATSSGGTTSNNDNGSGARAMDEPRTSKGCQLGAASSPRGIGVGLAVLGLAVLARRRRGG